AAHQNALRAACERHRGVEVDSHGDSLFFAFVRASDAVAAADDAQADRDGAVLSSRIGIHTGEPDLIDGRYVGMDVHVAARICAAGHGGQVLLSKTTRDLVDAEVSDLGEHRLTGLDGFVRLYQLGRQDFGSPRTTTAGNVPAPAAPLLGRKRELVDRPRLLRSERARLVTLTGPGGIGKTRLAVALAGELVEHYPHGVWFVDLSAVRDPQLVLPTIASAVGASDGLAQHLPRPQLLLLLGNLEQGLAAAPA